MPWLTGSSFSPLLVITKPFGSACAPDGPGVYRLVALEDASEALRPVQLTRLFGTDHSGTLYIGRTEDRSSIPGKPASLNGRLGQLQRSIISNDAHPAGRLLKAIPKVRQRFTTDKLAITWEFTSTPTAREHELLREYQDEFGERPPLNQRT